MHLYAPRYVNLGHLVVDIATLVILNSSLGTFIISAMGQMQSIHCEQCFVVYKACLLLVTGVVRTQLLAFKNLSKSGSPLKFPD